jgi:hypothetical protein
MFASTRDDVNVRQSRVLRGAPSSHGRGHRVV